MPRKTSALYGLLIMTAIISLLHWLGVILDWYQRYPLIDVPLHMLGGAWVALAFYYLGYLRHQADLPTKTLPFLLIGLGVVAIVGIGWEIFEFVVDVAAEKYPLLGAPGRVHFDTLKDLVNDLLGGLIILIAIKRSVRD